MTAGSRPQMTNGEREQWRRLLPRQQMHPDACACEHPGGLVGELVAAVPRVASDDDAGLRTGLIAVA